MPWYYWLIIIYLVFINIFAFSITVADKNKAQKGKWRIRERTLFLTAALGGAVTMLITMKKIRHKTKHKSFMIGIPAIIIAQTLLVIFFIFISIK